jgi:hypothetical protein
MEFIPSIYGNGTDSRSQREGNIRLTFIMVIKSLRHVSAFMLLTRPMVSVAQSSQGPDPYAPVYVDCPSGLSVRDASNVRIQSIVCFYSVIASKFVW